MATLDQRPADDLAGIRDALARLAAVAQHKPRHDLLDAGLHSL
jgi:hypothetical protein